MCPSFAASPPLSRFVVIWCGSSRFRVARRLLFLPPSCNAPELFFFDCLSWFGVLRRGSAPQRLRFYCSSVSVSFMLRFAPSVSRLVLALFDSRL